MINKKILIQGEKGDTGSAGTDTTVPMNGIIAFKGDVIPTGYQLYSEVPDGVLTHITATYTQTATITDASSLDDLRPDLIVKAYYYDAETGITSEYVITDYTLSGTLTVGTSTITASYKGFSDTFEVTVESSINYLYNWDLKTSLIDIVNSKVASVSGAATFIEGVGVVFSGATGRLTLQSSNVGGLLKKGQTYEIDVAIMDKAFSNTHGRFIMVNESGGFCWRNNTSQWEVYDKTASKWLSYTQTSNDYNAFNNKTLKMIITTYDHMDIYADDTLVYSGKSLLHIDTHYAFYIGQATGGTTTPQAYYNLTITGVRIYETPQGGNQ